MSDAKAMTLPEPNTPEELVWFAGLCGWTKCARDPDECFYDTQGNHRIARFRTSIADAIELAGIVGLRVLQQLRSGEWGVWAPIGVNGWTLSKIDDDLCTAICEAVRAKGVIDA